MEKNGKKENSQFTIKNVLKKKALNSILSSNSPMNDNFINYGFSCKVSFLFCTILFHLKIGLAKTIGPQIIIDQINSLHKSYNLVIFQKNLFRIYQMLQNIECFKSSKIPNLFRLFKIIFKLLLAKKISYFLFFCFFKNFSSMLIDQHFLTLERRKNSNKIE